MAVYLVGDMRLPESIVDSINAKIQALQKTQQREEELAKLKQQQDEIQAQINALQ